MNMAYELGSTIAAIATPPGEGAIAIIRLSGKDALEIGSKIFSGPLKSFKSHTAHYGYIKDADGKVIDSVLILPMHAPKTFTGEDTVEIFCHGGSLIAKKVLERTLTAGARSALGGEFSFRAFMNGKIDLAQAEAIQELIAAKNEYAVKAAEERLQGLLSQKVTSFQQELIKVAAILDAWVDFPEEDLAFASMEEIVMRIDVSKKAIDALIETFEEGKIVHEGLKLCLLGSPNVGKSSLMNALLDMERAIVTDIPGTTRDVLEDDVRIGGLHCKILDTAGIRETDEVIEKEGIRRSKKAADESDLLFLLLDASHPVDAHNQELIQTAPREKTILVWNKTDLKHPELPSFGFDEVVHVSAKTKQGLENLRKSVERKVWKKGALHKEELILTNVRHKEALQESSEYLQKVIDGLKNNVSPEFIAFDMRSALSSLGKILGMDVGEEVLTSIFSQFCLGK